VARVLIVDDVDMVLRVLQGVVRKMGHTTDSASSSKEALALAQANPPDLALVDYQMAGMDGVALFSALKQKLGVRCPKVLFVSASPPEEVRMRLEPQGLRPVGFVTKPCNFEDLLREVDLALSA